MAVKLWLQLFPVRSYYFWIISLLITPRELITRRFMTIEIIRSPRGAIYLVIGGGKPMDFRIQCYSAGRIIFVNICLGIFTRRLIDPDSHLGLCIQNNVYPISDHRRRFIRKKFNTLHAPEREKKSGGWILYDADVDNILLPPPKKRGAISETNCPAVAGIKRNQSSTHAWTLITIIIDWIQYLQW